jgi:hypothetical protein
MVNEVLKESGFGIASFVLGLIMLVAWFVLVSAAAIGVAEGASESSPLMIVIGLFMFAGFGANLVGIVLGIIAVSKSNVKKTFAIIGISLNSIVMLGVIILMLIGLAIS